MQEQPTGGHDGEGDVSMSKIEAEGEDSETLDLSGASPDVVEAAETTPEAAVDDGDTKSPAEGLVDLMAILDGVESGRDHGVGELQPTTSGARGTPTRPWRRMVP